MDQMIIPLTAETVKPKDHWITKANALVEGHYRLTLIQQRMVLTMASLVQPGDEDFKSYRLDIKHFASILGGNNHDYREMVASVHGLMEKVITIFIGEKEFLKTHWVQNARGLITGGSYVDVTFDPELKPFLLHLKERFTTYKLENVIKLKSIYSIRIYELLKQYQAVGKRTITIEKLRGMLGISAKEYRLYGDFKRKVILVAHKEINERTDLSFEFKEIKLGRKVNEIEFTIEIKKTAPADNGDKKKPVPLAALSNEELCRLYQGKGDATA